ncbi:putative arsenite resistance protein ars2 [Golovinomyces cichoracearum]|uniref:Putative arsenite resistance protein ars2 n=1 Tax=Golovinomyces cichoracearum TaxID=62708 RepID=A0A420JBN9_9PEZI|nr:putative arsenite resistance protein ars2 [Golovinomyces cichoracearum]
MDTYQTHREPLIPRSPTERTSWASRDTHDATYRNERTDNPRSDSFFRGRSPGTDRRRIRDRTRSPTSIDRYEPSGTRSRDEYDRKRERIIRDRGEPRRVSPAPANIDRYVPGQDPGPQPLTVNMIQDPSTLPFQVGFSYFGEWWRTNERIKEEREAARTGKRRDIRRLETQEEREKEKSRIQVAYDVYKQDLQAKMARAFVQEHKGEQWFQERYFAEPINTLRAQLNEFRRGNYSQWEQDLESGTFDDYTLEGIPKSESNGAGGVLEKEEGETSAANEVLGVGDLVPSRGSDIRDENAFQPTLLIKTIAPHVSRQNLEAFCKEHLGEDEGGFKWLSLSDPNPSKRYHRIGWVMLHPAPELVPIVDRPDPKDVDEDGKLVMAPVVPQSTVEKALEAINGKVVKDEVRGDFQCHVGVHVPPAAPRKKALWDLFSAPERIEKDLGLARRLVHKFEEGFGSDFNAVLKIEDRVEELRLQGRLHPPITTPEVPKTKNSTDFLGMDEAIDEAEETGDLSEEEEEEGAVDDEVDDEDLLVKKKQLDLMVEYFRRVFNFCFFCVFESDSVHELTRKCPGGHLRRPRNTLTCAGKTAARASALGEPFPGKKKTPSEMDEEPDTPEGDRKAQRSQLSKTEQQLQRAFNWVKTFEEKITQILDPDSIDIQKLGGKPIDEAVKEELTKFVKQEDEHKFRCRVPECLKLFKEEHFWRKHVEKRHSEWLEGIKRDFELINTYVLDPAHIAPSRSDSNSNGHFPPANGHLSAGTPRGFNLQSFGMTGIPMQSFGQPGFPPLFPGTVQHASIYTSNGGPIRRGARQQNTRPGPYDRRSRETGRLSPPSSARRSGGRWGDGIGGAAVGPREAVQGRILKSYEDLDAVAGGGSGELNY